MTAKIKAERIKNTKVGKKREGWTAVTQSTGNLIDSDNTAELRGEEDTVILAISRDTVGCISKSKHRQ